MYFKFIEKQMESSADHALMFLDKEEAMKRKLIAAIMLVLALGMMTGCGNQEASKTTEEDGSKANIEQSASVDEKGGNVDSVEKSEDGNAVTSDVSDGGEEIGSPTSDDVYVVKIVQTMEDYSTVDTGKTITYPMNPAYMGLQHDEIDETCVDALKAMLDPFLDADFSYEMHTNTIELNGEKISLPCSLAELLPEDQLDEDGIKRANYKYAKGVNSYHNQYVKYDKLVEPIAKDGVTYANATIYFRKMGKEDEIVEYKDMVVYGILIEPVDSATREVNDTIQSFNVAGITQDMKLTDALNVIGEPVRDVIPLHKSTSTINHTWFDVDGHLMIQIIARNDGVITHLYVGEQKLSYDFDYIGSWDFDREVFSYMPAYIMNNRPVEQCVEDMKKKCPRFFK